MILDIISYFDGCIVQLTKVHTLSCKVKDLIHSRRDESHGMVSIITCTCFIKSSIHDEPLTNIVCVKGKGKIGNENKSKLVEECSGVEVEI